MKLELFVFGVGLLDEIKLEKAWRIVYYELIDRVIAHYTTKQTLCTLNFQVTF
jgi:hypothetical protein